MGVYIKGMEMPTEEQSVITINIYSDGVVTCYDDDVERKAVSVPPHGRLGDLDELWAQCDDPYWCVWRSEIEDAPTIIEAEEE